VQSWPSIGHRPTVRNRPATPCSPSDFASGIEYSSSSASPKFTTGSPPSPSAQIGEANQRARRREIVGPIDPVSGSPPVPPEESTWRRRRRSRSPRTATSAAAPSPPSAAAYASSPSHIRVHTSLSGCCESHRRSAGSSGNTVALVF
jgi:hypothetical protein